MMAIIIGTYYGFFGPAIVMYLVDYDHNVKRYVLLFVNAFFYLNAVLNPIIYAWMNRDFGNALRKILRMQKIASHNSKDINTETSNVFCTQSLSQ